MMGKLANGGVLPNKAAAHAATTSSTVDAPKEAAPGPEGPDTRVFAMQSG